MSLIGNIVWIICGGFISFLLYMIGGAFLCVTIIGIPFGLQQFKLGIATLAPFGKRQVEMQNANSPMRIILNLLWIVTFGWAIAVNHVFWAIVLGITIIGIPFAYQHLKLAILALLPFGRAYV